jgi:uncharacterized protein with HEPN domain
VRGDRDRLLDILESIDRIARHTQSGRPQFEADELVQIWVVHHIEILGEAARGISEALRGRHPEVHWREITAMRNVLSHRYFGIDVEAVWTTVERDLPRLKAMLEAVLSDFNDE